ncbi:hypothetical protein Ndes2437B_g07817 [Nannochloris sp. 'desiccata']
MNTVYKLQALKSGRADSLCSRIRESTIVNDAYNGVKSCLATKGVMEVDIWSDRDPAGNGLDDSISYDDILGFSHELLMQPTKKAARDRALMIGSIASASRGETMRNMRMHLFAGTRRLQSVGPCSCFVVPYRSQGEKQHDLAQSDFIGFGVARNVLMCPLFAFATYFMARYTLDAEPLPDINNKAAWRLECVFPSDKSRTTPMSYNSHLSSVNSMMEDNGIATTAKTHVLRKTGAQLLEMAGVSLTTLQKLGHWNQQSVLTKIYMMMIAPEGILAAGGWPDVNGNNYEHFFHSRLMVYATEGINKCIFPFLEKFREAVNLRRASKQECFSQNAVLQLFDYLALVFFQGCLDLVNTGRALDKNGDCVNPCIARLYNHPDFQMRLQQYKTCLHHRPAYLCGDGEELNQEFTVPEIVDGISALQGSKAVTGFLEPDMLKPIAEQVAPAIQALFNAVVRQKRMPSTMSTGVITMALKPKATTTALHDHRTITVGTVMDILYSLCLTRRLKQGQPSSPDLFGFYVDDIPAAVQALGPNAASPTLDGTTVDPFLHADDIALVSTTEEGLQRQLDALHDYATTWGLQISLVKTNIMRLSGGSPEDDLSTRPTFTINGQPLKWVREFIYLGVTFHETTNMDLLMAETRLLKGRTAQALTRYQCSRLGLTNPGVQVSLLNALVRSTMEYGIEVWGPDYLNKAAALTGNDPAEVLHRHFLRRLLGVRPNTPNLIIYSEFGRYPLRYHWNKRIYAYYQRLTKLTAEGHRFILAAALRDNMQLATTQQAAGIGYSQQAWVGKVSECLGKFGITINLSATAAAIPTIHPSEVETAGQRNICNN